MILKKYSLKVLEKKLLVGYLLAGQEKRILKANDLFIDILQMLLSASILAY
jgi:hypothetical protein